MSGIGELIRVGKRAGRAMLGRQMAGPGATAFPDDVFLVSYPRSGNTWARFLIGNLLYPDDPCTFLNIESRIPDIYYNPDWKLRRLPRPRILKSHEPFKPWYPRVIYIVRDPRDVAVSNYHHNVKTRNLPDGYSIDEFVPRFMRPEFDGGSGSWAENVLSWLALRQGKPSFLLLRYEDMRRGPESELSRIACFLKAASFPNVEDTPGRLARVVELSSSDRMRRLEREQSTRFVGTSWTRQDKPFVREATSGGWRYALSQASVAQIESAWGPLMRRLGYAPGVCVGSSPAPTPLSEGPTTAGTRAS